MKLHTCSEVISFVKKLENKSADFYSNLLEKYAKDRDVLLSFIKENSNNAAQVDMAYYGVISDAFEGCFTFDIETGDYVLEIDLPDDTSYPDVLDKAIEIEKKMIKLYNDAAGQSQSLITDVARAFSTIAKKKKKRVTKLNSLR